MSEVVYLDSSALTKLVVAEGETGALRSYLSARPEQVTSALTRVEVSRACLRAGGCDPARLEAVLERIAYLQLDATILRRAAGIRPPTLRTLDAIHLASALRIAPDEVVAYDRRLIDAGGKRGLAISHPGVAA